MSSRIALKGINGEKDSFMTLNLTGIDVVVGKQTFAALNSSAEYTRLFRANQCWGSDKVSFEMGNDDIKVIVIVPHHIISCRKAEYMLSKILLYAHLD